ncbi:interferon-induced very large GTPase 1-like [Mytilus trossulus]|uniref:interferon-induced very large GTPase 1-like n=1 Tax=Mytilus trossulus TaxID=6551 RepID=UPI0030059B4B
MEKLKAIRGGHRSVVTKLITRTNDKISKSDIENHELSAAIETLVKKRNLLEDFDSKIQDGTEVDDIGQEIVDSDEYNLQVDEAIHKFKDIIKNLDASVLKSTNVETCIQKPSLLIDIVDSDFEGNQTEHPPRQKTEDLVKNSEISEVMSDNDIGRDEYYDCEEIIYDREENKDTDLLQDETRKQMLTPTNVTTERSTLSTTEEQSNKVLIGKKLEDVENADTPGSTSIPKDTYSDMINFLERIGLKRFYPNKLMFMDAMRIKTAKKYSELKDVALKFLIDIVMINCACRDQMLYLFLEKIAKKEESKHKDTSVNLSLGYFLDDIKGEDETNINPLDLLLALFKCSDPMLKQMIANKLFMCKLAIPFILPEFGNEPLEICMWPLRSIILEKNMEKGPCQDMSVECPCEIISFVRIGCPSVSKSKLANEILTDQYHNTFSNKDCPLGTAKRILSDGIVEAAWYIPSDKSAVFRNTAMFLNLRGNAISHRKQLCAVAQLSDILVILVLLSDLEGTSFKEVIYDIVTTKKGVVLAIDAFQNNRTEASEKIDGFIKTVENHNQMIKVCFLSMCGKMKDTSTVKSEMRNAISGMMKEHIAESLFGRIHRCKMTSDEESTLLKRAKSKALEVMQQISNVCSDVKASAVPLQGDTWTDRSQKLKNVNKSSYYKTLQEQGKIRKEMFEDRQKQLQQCKNLGPFMKTFIDILSDLINSDIDCILFVLWLKHFLDQRSRSVIPGYLIQYQTAHKILKASMENKGDAAAIAKNRKALTQSEFDLAEASFGFEHLCREMGQMYESIAQCKSEENNLKKLRATLPFISAKLLYMGYPFEIMDGDVANVPLCWIRAVLEKLKDIIGEKKLLAMSVLGIQSSGKSTLLNAMFGLQFAVSAGRCTRGVFIQLVPVDSPKFDYVLVIDTEGLRAPELANQKFNHDNELATFVIGLGDITIVNVKGENPAEMKDILQIVVHGFLRLKLANEKLNLKHSCVFVHQNVPASNAYYKLITGRKKFLEFLDKMTRVAADEENVANIQSFNQVIDFDSEQNVWYFSDLWQGDPPMAPANTGYSESVSNVKDAIINRLTEGRNTYLNIVDTISRIEDLWNGILKEDFVFSFRNSLELKAYNTMDHQFQTITWKLEKYVLEFIKSEAKSKIVSCGNKDALETVVSTIMIKLTKDVDKQVENLNNELDSFVKNSTLKDVMMQWTQVKRNKLSILAESFIMKAKKAVNNTKEEIRIQKLQVSEKNKHEMEINKRAKELAVLMKGQVPCEDVLQTKFNGLWIGWIHEFETHVIDDDVPISTQIQLVVSESFPSEASTFSKDEKQNLRYTKAYQNMKQLEGTVTVDDVTAEHMNICKWSRGIFKREMFSNRCKTQVIDFTNMIFRKIDLKLNHKRYTDGIRFHTSYVTEILYIVLNEFNDFNNHKKNDYEFKLQNPFRAMILRHVVRYATVFFTRQHDAYNKKNSPKAQMEQYKNTAWKLFKNTVEDKTEDVITLGFFRDAIVKAVVDQVSDCLNIDAVGSIRTLYAGGKEILNKDILVDLADANDFARYKSFILDPHTFVENWILQKFKTKLFEEKTGHLGSSLYSQKAQIRVKDIFQHISASILKATMDCQDGTSNYISKWTDAFIKHNSTSSNLPLSIDALRHVRDRKISNLDTFLGLLTEQLSDIETKVLSSFSNVKPDTVQWKENPIPDLMDYLWGCSQNCMFCKEPCGNINKNHLKECSHMCLQHRPDGIGGFKWKETTKMSVDFCNASINTDVVYNKGGKTGKFRNYKENFPDWEIQPDHTVSKYWMWVMCKYKDQLKEMYNTDDPDIPEDWWLISREEAIDSLKKCIIEQTAK